MFLCLPAPLVLSHLSAPTKWLCDLSRPRSLALSLSLYLALPRQMDISETNAELGTVVLQHGYCITLLIYTHSFSHPHTHAHIHTHYPTHLHTYPPSLTHTHTQSHSPTLFPSLHYTRTHTNTHTRTHTHHLSVYRSPTHMNI